MKKGPKAFALEEGAYGDHQTPCGLRRLNVLASKERACRAFGISFAPCLA